MSDDVVHIVLFIAGMAFGAKAMDIYITYKLKDLRRTLDGFAKSYVDGVKEIVRK